MNIGTYYTTTVKDIPWFYQDSSPMLHLFVPKAEGVAQAVVEAIKDYFKR